MTFAYPNAVARFCNKQLDWDTDDIRCILVMANSTAGQASDADSVFVADIATLDECNGAGYARTAMTGRSIGIDTVLKIVSLIAAQTDFPATAAGTRQNIAAVIYHHVGADNANPVVAYVDDTPWFPHTPLGNPIRIKWNPLGIIRIPCTPSP